MKRMFPTKQLKDWGLPSDGDPDADVEVIEDTITSTSRWSVHHDLVFRLGPTHYSTSYSVGATEQQNERPWEYEEEVECVEVRAVQKTITAWEPIDSDSIKAP